MASSNKIEIIIQGRDEASGPLKNVRVAVEGIGNAATGAGGRVTGFFSNMLSTAGGVLAAGVLSNIASQISSVASAMVSGNAEFERYETQFGVLLGSAEAAKERLAALAEFGATTPFELPEVVRADKILQSFGLHAEDVAARFGMSGAQIRTVAGDVAAGTGASFEEIAGYLGKFSSGATGEAIARFQELGIVTRQEMAAMGIEFSKSGEMLTPVEEAMDVLLLMMQDKFGGMMAAQSSTFEGMMSNLMDWKDATIRQLGEPIFEVAKEQLGNLLQFLGSAEVQNAISTFANALATGIGKTMEFVSRVVGTVAESWGEFQYALAEGGSILDGIQAALYNFNVEMGMHWEMAKKVEGVIDGLFGLFGGLVGPIVELATQFVSWRDVLAAFGVVIAATVAPALWGIASAAAPVIAIFAGIVGVVAVARAAFEGRLGEMWATVQEKFGQIVTFIQEQWPVWQAQLAEWGKAAWKWIADVTPVVLARLGEWGGQLRQWLADNLPGWIGTLASWAQQAWQWIVDAIPVALTKLDEWGASLLQWLGDSLPGWMVKLAEWATEAIQWIADSVPGLIEAAGQWLESLIDWATEEGTPEIENQMADWAERLWKWIEEKVIPEVAPAMLKLSAVLVDALIKVGEALWETALTIGSKIVSKLAEGIRNNAGALAQQGGAALQGLLPDFNIPGFAHGTSFAPGGLALVGEWGPELVNLPRGSRVYSNRETREMIGPRTVNNYTINAHYAHQPERRLRDDIRLIEMTQGMV